MSNYSRSIQDDNSQGGAKQLYVFPYIEISESNITVVNNTLTSFPLSTIYDLNASDITFEESVSEFYEQKVSFKLKKLLAADQLKDLAKKDFRIIIKDNNSNLRLLGLYTGLEGKFTKSIGTTRSDFNGYNFNFETKEEQTAPYISSSVFSNQFIVSVKFFQFQVTTNNSGTSNNDQFTLPLTSAFTNNITVDWGDSTTSNITSYNQSEVTHTYSSSGTYNIKILGAITDGWIFNNGGDCLKMGDITTWGEFSCTAANTFYGCANMTSIGIDVNFLNQATNLSYYFYNCGLTSLPSTLTLANLTNGNGIFYNNSLTDLPSGITFSNLTDGTNILSGNTINTTRYSQLLVDLENLNSNNNFSFHGGNSNYNTTGQTARNILTASPRNLTITDGGLLIQFEFQVTTNNAGTSNNDQFTLPLTSAFTNNITVDWGDSTTSNITSYNQSEVTHTYSSSGTYDIKISGAITDGWIFANGGDCLKMGDISKFGSFSCIAASTFYGCANMTSIGSDVDFLNQATTLGAYFENCGLTSLPSTLTLANLTNGYNMLRNNSLTSLPSGITLANLVIASNMFRDNSLTALPSVMTLASLTDGSYMFYNNSLTALPSVMTLASLTDGTYMFRSNSLTSLPSVMTLASLTNGRVMFDGNSLTSLPSGMILTNLVTSYYMFNNNSLTALPSGMILANVTSAALMFNNNSLTVLPSVMTFASLTSGSSVFSNNSLTDLPSGITFSNLTDGASILSGNTINTTRYSQLLVDLENLNSNNNFSFHGGNSKYNTTGQTARNILTASPRNLTITDGGLV